MTFDFDNTAEEVVADLDLTGKTILITGVNSGLGQESARVLAARGAQIIGLARTKEKAEAGMAQAGAKGHAVECDLADLGTVRAAVSHCHHWGPIDVIIANAGIMALPELEQIDGIERQLFVNHIGHFVLINGILDKLVPNGRVVVLSSGAHFMASKGLELDNASGEDSYDPWRMYGRSKLANILYARGLAKRLGRTDIHATSVHPGVIKTNLSRHMDAQEATSLFDDLASKGRMKSVGQGAATQVFAAVHPDAAGLNGEYLADCAVAPTLDVAKDDDACEALWGWTERVVSP